MTRRKAPRPPAAGPARRAPIPHRPVITLALVLFVPDVLLVLDGNVSVQTALLRFAAALVISWCAARLIIATIHPAARDVRAGLVAPQARPASATAPPGTPTARGDGPAAPPSQSELQADGQPA